MRDVPQFGFRTPLCAPAHAGTSLQQEGSSGPSRGQPGPLPRTSDCDLCPMTPGQNRPLTWDRWRREPLWDVFLVQRGRSLWRVPDCRTRPPFRCPGFGHSQQVAPRELGHGLAPPRIAVTPLSLQLPPSAPTRAQNCSLGAPAMTQTTWYMSATAEPCCSWPQPLSTRSTSPMGVSLCSPQGGRMMYAVAQLWGTSGPVLGAPSHGRASGEAASPQSSRPPAWAGGGAWAVWPPPTPALRP